MKSPFSHLCGCCLWRWFIITATPSTMHISWESMTVDWWPGSPSVLEYDLTPYLNVRLCCCYVRWFWSCYIPTLLSSRWSENVFTDATEKRRKRKIQFDTLLRPLFLLELNLNSLSYQNPLNSTVSLMWPAFTSGVTELNVIFDAVQFL